MSATEHIGSCNFLTLPLELRLHIYSQLFKMCKSQTYQLRFTVKTALPSIYGIELCRLPLPQLGNGILLSCKPIYVEIMSYLYSRFKIFKRKRGKRPLDISQYSSENLTLVEVAGAISSVECRPLIAPMLFRAHQTCLANEETALRAVELKAGLSMKPTQPLISTSNISLFLQDIDLRDESGLLYAITQPEDWGNARIYTRESVRSHVRFKHIEELRKCIYAFSMILSQQRRHVPALNIYPAQQAIHDRTVILDFERLLRDEPIHVHVHVCGVTERWHEMAEKRIKATLHLDNFEEQHFSFARSSGQTRRQKRKAGWHAQDGSWFTLPDGSTVEYESVCGYNPD